MNIIIAAEEVHSGRRLPPSVATCIGPMYQDSNLRFPPGHGHGQVQVRKSKFYQNSSYPFDIEYVLTIVTAFVSTSNSKR